MLVVLRGCGTGEGDEEQQRDDPWMVTAHGNLQAGEPDELTHRLPSTGSGEDRRMNSRG